MSLSSSSCAQTISDISFTDEHTTPGAASILLSIRLQPQKLYLWRCQNSTQQSAREARTQHKFQSFYFFLSSTPPGSAVFDVSSIQMMRRISIFSVWVWRGNEWILKHLTDALREGQRTVKSLTNGASAVLPSINVRNVSSFGNPARESIFQVTLPQGSTQLFYLSATCHHKS